MSVPTCDARCLAWLDRRTTKSSRYDVNSKTKNNKVTNVESCRFVEQAVPEVISKPIVPMVAIADPCDMSAREPVRGVDVLGVDWEL